MLERRRPRAALLAVIGLVLSLAATTLGAGAASAVTVTKYGFSAQGYASYVNAGAVSSARSAYSLIGCTKAVPRTTSNSVATVNPSEALDVGAGTTRQTTRLTAAGTSIVQSTTKLADVRLGSAGLGVEITGIEAISRAYGTKGGKLNAYSTFTFDSIQPVGFPELPPPLDGPINAVLEELATGAPVEIPGVGVIKMGRVAKAVNNTRAQSGSIGLQVLLYGPDQRAAGGDDFNVLIGRSFARIDKRPTQGVFSGSAWGIEGKALGGAASIGRNPNTPMSCHGTGGRVVTRVLAGLDLPAQNTLEVGALKNRVYGIQNTPRGGNTGWTESSVASVRLGGQLEITGIMSRAKVIQSVTGRRYPTSVQRIGSITAGGTTYEAPDPGQSIQIPGVARIAVPRPVRNPYGIKVTAVRITLLGGSAAGTELNLATSNINVRRY